MTQKLHKKLKPGLVASYDIWPGNGQCLFLFWHFINSSLTYLLTGSVPHAAYFYRMSDNSQVHS